VRLGIGYIYTIFRYGYPPKVADDLRALDEIRDMGFHFLEMEGLGPVHTQAVWDARETLKARLQRNGIRMHNFCAVDPDLVTADTARRRAALAAFERSVELADYLGADTVHLASYAPPVQYQGASPYSLDKDYAFGDTFRLRIPPGFSWERTWEVLVESCAACADTAARRGKTVIMEPRVGEVVCSVDSMIRLIDDVDRPNFKANFDTAHFSAQRENVVLALAKLEGRFAKIHVADNDPKDTSHLAIGRGSIDWEEFFRVLVSMGFDGYLSLDLGGGVSLAADYAASVRALQDLAARLGFALEV
jgi:sugar phosphate isomerase/epimerase